MTVDTQESVLVEFREVLNDISATHEAALWGLNLICAQMTTNLAAAPDPEADLLFGEGPPDDPDTIARRLWKIGEIPQQLAKDGPVAQRLGQQWAVMIYAQWEHSFRPRLAAVAGIEPNDVKDDLMGDIRHLRHDILHHSGIATQKHAARCKVLRWFEAGDPISISSKRVTEFMDLVGLTLKP
jgi:hypothetical protein